jgi:hypothetical protein
VSEILSSSRPTARKTHRCWWCAEVIDLGETYERWSYVNDDGFGHVKCHLECKRAWDQTSADEDGWFDCMFGEFKRGKAASE